jgi:hypothetical protein
MTGNVKYKRKIKLNNSRTAVSFLVYLGKAWDINSEFTNERSIIIVKNTSVPNDLHSDPSRTDTTHASITITHVTIFRT